MYKSIDCTVKVQYCRQSSESKSTTLEPDSLVSQSKLREEGEGKSIFMSDLPMCGEYVPNICKGQLNI